jgi:hypothetical protein
VQLGPGTQFTYVCAPSLKRLHEAIAACHDSKSLIGLRRWRVGWAETPGPVTHGVAPPLAAHRPAFHKTG